MDDLQAQAISFLERRGPAALNSVHMGAESNVTRFRQRTTTDTRTDQVIVQDFAVGPDSQVKDVEQKTILNLEKRRYWFDMLVQEFPSGEAGAKPIPFSISLVLRAGRTYHVRASLSENEYRPLSGFEQPALCQNELRIVRDLTLGLELQGSKAIVEAIGTLVNFEAHFPLNELVGWSHDFVLAIPNNAPSGTLGLLLTYREAGSTIQPYDATLLTVALEGIEAGAPSKPEDLAIGVKLPPHTAILHIHPEDETQLRLFATSCDNLPGLLPLHPVGRPTAAPENYHEEADYLDAISEIIYDYAIYDPGHLGAWFEKVLATYPQDGCIVIDDLTDSRIPWEMFKLRNARYLGAHALVVRWTSAHYRGLTHELERGEARYQGRVAAYIHPDAEATTQAAGPLLDTLRSACCAMPEDLQYTLFPEEDMPPVGLVYVAHQGVLIYGDEKEAAAGLYTPQGVSLQIRFDEAEGLLTLRPLFIVNAPFSGRILRRGQVSCGLAHAVLAQVASGLIGTLGPVDRAFAAEIALRLLQAAASTQGIQPARLLYELRAEVVKMLQDPKTPASRRAAARRRLLYTFMYVYYGNPEAHIRVLPGDAEAGGSVQEPDHG